MRSHQYVLVVDDDERVLFILNRALSSLGNAYRIETAQGGREALEKAKRTLFDVLVTDLMMPGMSGVELTAEIKGLNPDTEVIWITAHGCHQFWARGKQLGVNRCLEKPIEIAAIRQAVVDALEHAES